ncbi:MAG: AAA family ATPase [Chloroflexota bacterium]
MIIWINGAFGAGKTSVTKLLLEEVADACVFDPEDMGYVIQKTFPEARALDYQDLALWRQLVTQFIVQAQQRFPCTLIIPMTLVVPAYLNEIFSEVTKGEPNFRHFFLETSKEELQRRITNQVIIESDAAKDEEVRQWRLAQIGRCVQAKSTMPENTIFLDTNTNSPAELVAMIMKECF